MLEIISFALFVLSISLSITSILFSITSWIILKKWRQFRNFVFLNFIIAGSIFLTWIHIWSTTEVLSIEFFLSTIVIMITHIQMTHWQLIATVMIYIALVDVFNSVKVRCKYLLVCLFAWVLPTIEGIVMCFGLGDWVFAWMVVSLLELSILFTNLVLYVRVVFNLVLLLKRQRISLREVCGKVLVSTLACVTAGLSSPVLGTILLIFVTDYGPISLFDPDMAILPNVINLLLANVLFLSMKSHRVLWAEYMQKVRESQAMQLRMPLPRNETLAP